MIEIVAYTINLSTVTEFKLCLTSKEATLKIRSNSTYSDVLGLKLNLVHQNNLTSLKDFYPDGCFRNLFGSPKTQFAHQL